MIHDLCPLCGSMQTLDEGWLACACDSDLFRTLTVRQAAVYLHRTPSCVYHLINDGYLAAIRDSHPLQIRLPVLKCYKFVEYTVRTPRSQQQDRA